MAKVVDYETGEVLADGLQGCDSSDEAMQVAERLADDLAAHVELVDDDGHWLVHPATWSGGEHGTPVCRHREPADFLQDLNENIDQ